MSDRLRSLNSLGDIEFAVKRIEELEAKLAKAIYRMNDLLRNAKIVVDGVNNDDLCASEVRYAESSIIDCQILLAELTGGNDE